MAADGANRVWCFLSDAEALEVANAAAERGLKPSALARTALLAFIRQSPAATPPAPAPADAAPVLARLEAVVDTLGRHAQAIGRAVPVMEDAWAEHEAVRGSLREIAFAVGTLAGAIEPAGEAAADAFGPVGG